MTTVEHPSTYITMPNGWATAVDEKIAPLLQALWSRNMVTEFSCQGSPNTKSPWDGWAYILFKHNDDALAFLQSFGDNDVVYGRWRDGARVLFPHELLGWITEVWSA